MISWRPYDVMSAPASMDHADQVNSVLKREVEKQDRFKPVCGWKAPHSLEFRLGQKDPESSFRLTGQHSASGIGGGNKAISDSIPAFSAH